jgi:hypothetical protein
MRIVAVVGLVALGSLLASADTIDSFTYAGTLSGTGITSTGVTGLFSYDLTTGTFLNASALFSGSSIFNNVSVSSSTAQNGALFFYLGAVFNSATQSYDLSSFQIVWNVLGNSPYSATGQICDFTGGGTCGSFSTTAFSAVPAGDFLDLLAAAILMAGALFVAQRRLRCAAGLQPVRATSAA